MSLSSEILSQDGPFSRSMKGFAVRACQQQMASAVESAIQRGDTLVVESGTGTGKTFGYLVPAIAHRKKTVISTFTNHLQDQIVERDIPLVCNALNAEPDVRVLKGRRHYLCKHRLERFAHQPELGFDAGMASNMEIVHHRLDHNPTGELDELLSGLGNRRELIQKLSSTSDNCLRNKCKFFDDCYVYQARQRARLADIVVVNHSLLCFSLLVQEDFSFLPVPDAVIVDEAHRLPDVAAESLGMHVSSSRFGALCDDFEKLAGEFQLNPDRYEKIIRNISNISSDLHTHSEELEATGSLEQLMGAESFMTQYRTLVSEVQTLADLVGEVCEDIAAFEPLLDSMSGLLSESLAIFDDRIEQSAQWYERGKSSIQMHCVPLDPSKRFKQMVDESDSSWILTSATLAVGDDFSHYLKRTGLEPGNGKQWESPFNYREQSLLFLPPDMPDPRSHEFNCSVAEIVRSVVMHSKGRAFVLFTSYKALREVKDLIQSRLDYTVLSQTDPVSRHELLQQFRSNGNAVLLGTSSFWEGVDVKGEALSCVIIDRLPFTAPGDPVLSARIKYMSSIGEEPFMQWQVPEAALTLKQGAGRLIRDIEDNGVLVLCDPRVMTKGYGAQFIQSLPPMPKTMDIRDVEKFFRDR